MTDENYIRMMTTFSETAKTFTQLGVAALILPITFIRHVLGIPDGSSIRDHLNPCLMSSWAFLLLSVGAGLLYQYAAARRIANTLHGTTATPIVIRRPDRIFGVMLVAFYCGAVFFVIGALTAK